MKKELLDIEKELIEAFIEILLDEGWELSDINGKVIESCYVNLLSERVKIYKDLIRDYTDIEVAKRIIQKEKESEE